MELNLTPNLNDPDDFYDELLAAHEGKDKAQSDAYNARLILILYELIQYISSRRIHYIYLNPYQLKP